VARLRLQRKAEGADSAALTALGEGRFQLSGDVGFPDAARLLAEGEAAFHGVSSVEVDLARVGRVDSAGLALLLEWSMSARDAGRGIRYRNMPPSLASLAGISDVAELLEPSGV
jgi:phospholipid transport system transporter-binding protein